MTLAYGSGCCARGLRPPDLQTHLTRRHLCSCSTATALPGLTSVLGPQHCHAVLPCRGLRLQAGVQRGADQDEEDGTASSGASAVLRPGRSRPYVASCSLEVQSAAQLGRLFRSGPAAPAANHWRAATRVPPTVPPCMMCDVWPAGVCLCCRRLRLPAPQPPPTPQAPRHRGRALPHSTPTACTDGSSRGGRRSIIIASHPSSCCQPRAVGTYADTQCPRASHLSGAVMNTDDALLPAGITRQRLSSVLRLCAV